MRAPLCLIGLLASVAGAWAETPTGADRPASAAGAAGAPSDGASVPSWAYRHSDAGSTSIYQRNVVPAAPRAAPPEPSAK